MVRAIAARELKTLFLSPLAWAVLAVVQLVLAYLFLSQLDRFMLVAPQLAGMEAAPGVTAIVVGPLLGDAAMLLLMVTPLLTMRLLSEERRARTLPLLLSAPVSMTEIVLGKFAGMVGFLLLMVALIALMPLSLLLGGALDFGMLGAGLLGLALTVTAFAAAGLFFSSLTSQPVVAAVSTFGLLLVLWILDWVGGAQQGTTALVGELSLLRHYQPLLKGVFSSADVAYFVLFIALFLGLAVRRLDAERLQH